MFASLGLNLSLQVQVQLKCFTALYCFAVTQALFSLAFGKWTYTGSLQEKPMCLCKRLLENEIAMKLALAHCSISLVPPL